MTEPQVGTPPPEPLGSVSSSWNATRDAVAFVEHLSILTRGGLPLPSGLRALSEELPRGSLRSTLLETAIQLERGTPLDEAMRLRAESFPIYLRGLVLAGIRANSLADVLAQFVRYRSLGQDLRRRFYLSLSYPLLLITSLSALLIFVMAAIIRSFDAIYRDFGLNLPTATTVLLRVTNLVLDHGGLIFLNLAIAIVALLIVVRLYLSPAQRRRLLFGIPVAGNVLKFACLAEFCHLLGTLVEARTPLPVALELAARASTDPSLVEGALKVKGEIERGRRFGQAIQAWSDCPPGLSEMLIWAELHENLPESLHLAGDMYEARATAQSNFSAVFFGTLCLIAVIWGVGFTIVALFLPLINLLSRLAG